MLIDELPRSVIIDGAEHAVNYGFRALMLIELCTFDEELSEEQRTLNALNLFYFNEIPENREAAVERLLWFYRGGETTRAEKKSKGAPAKVRRCYDFEQDQKYIYAAFMSQYHIDLQDISSNELHWWKFKAMFECLDKDCKLSEIMGYRLADLKNFKGKQKEFYRKMKALYALKDEAAADNRLALAERDRMMKEYVKRRFEGVCNGR